MLEVEVFVNMHPVEIILYNAVILGNLSPVLIYFDVIKQLVLHMRLGSTYTIGVSPVHSHSLLAICSMIGN